MCLDLLSLPGHINVYRLIRVTWENQIKLCGSQSKYLSLKKDRTMYHKNLISFIILSKLSSHSALYMQSTRVDVFPLKMFYSSSTGGSTFISSCTALQCGLIKQSQGDCCFFSFVTGKHKAACYQVKQDKLKTLRWLSHWKPHLETVFCAGQAHTWTH